MANKFKDQKEALALSIEMEKEGYSFYKKTAENAADEMTKDVFEFLAKEELKHIDAIKTYYDAEIANSKVDIASIKGSQAHEDAKKAILNLFEGLDKKVPVDKPDLEAYRFARDFEKNGERFYREAASEATDPNVIKLFEFLVEEELRHFQMIDDSLAYLENPAEWFHRLEKWHMNG